MHLPQRLLSKPVGVIAPASAPTDPGAANRGISHLRSLGLNVQLFRSEFSPNGYLAGADDVRAGELNHFLRRTDVDVLFCLRGGYGSLRILDKIDYAAARENPKVLVGYSDITALQLALLNSAGCVSVSGSMVAVEFGSKAVSDQSTLWELFRAAPPFTVRAPDGSALQCRVSGSAKGRLIGGNLSVLTRLLGTPHCPDFTGSILFVEDVDEAPYRIDSMLAHLKLAGVLDLLAGVILGAFTDCAPAPGKPSLSLDDVFARYLDDLGIPVAEGLCYGHFPVKNAMPIGIEAHLSASDGETSLTLLESVWSTLDRSTSDRPNRPY